MAWLKYIGQEGLNCLTGNNFTNFAIESVDTTITSCMIPGIIDCAEQSESCLDEIHGDVDQSLIDYKGYFFVDNYSKPIIEVSTAPFALENIDISGDSSNAVILHSNNSILLVDANISHTIVKTGINVSN